MHAALPLLLLLALAVPLPAQEGTPPPAAVAVEATAAEVADALLATLREAGDRLRRAGLSHRQKSDLLAAMTRRLAGALLWEQRTGKGAEVAALLRQDACLESAMDALAVIEALTRPQDDDERLAYAAHAFLFQFAEVQRLFHLLPEPGEECDGDDWEAES